MSRDYRDQPGGHPSKFFISDKRHAKFARQCRRRGRFRAAQDLRAGREPLPVYPAEREWFD